MPLMIALGVLVILGGFVYYTEENPPASDDDKTPIVDVEQDSIQKIIVTRLDKDPIELQRGEDDKWTFGEPLTIPADEFSVNSMVSSLASMDSDRVVEENVINWTPYGLTGGGTVQVEAEVKAEAEDDKTYRVIFGSDTPTGSGVYARLDGDPRLFTVYSYVKSGFEKEVFDLRDKKLLQVDDDKIARVVLNASGGSIEFGKTGDDAWQILQPRPLRADNFTVGDLVRSVRNAEMMSVLEEGGEPSGEYDFSKPTASVEVVDEGGTHSLTVAKDEEDKYYAKSSDLEGVYEVSSTMAEGLDKKLEGFRNKKLFDFGFKEISKLELRDGGTRVAVEKKEDKWRLTSEDERELDSGKVQTTIDKLRDLTAKSFTSDNKADLGMYGLTAPVIEAKVALAEGGGDEVVISSPEEDLVYAARAGQPSTYEVEKSAVEAIQQAIQELLEQEEPEDEEAEDPPEPQP